MSEPKPAASSRRVNFTLTAGQVKRIQEAIYTSPYAEVRQRASAIHRLHQGDSPETVAQALGVGMSTVWRWHRRWRRLGARGLVNQPRSGRPAKATNAYLRRLQTVAQTEPQALGLSFNQWTMNRLRLYMSEQTGIQLSETRLRAIFTTPRFRRLKPKPRVSMVKQLKQARQRLKVILPLLDERDAAYFGRIRGHEEGSDA